MQRIGVLMGIAEGDPAARAARKLGADWAAWGTVQKVSNLILNINLYMGDERAGKATICEKRRYPWQHR